jgi:hypothetical protein
MFALIQNGHETNLGHKELFDWATIDRPHDILARLWDDVYTWIEKNKMSRSCIHGFDWRLRCIHEARTSWMQIQFWRYRTCLVGNSPLKMVNLIWDSPWIWDPPWIYDGTVWLNKHPQIHARAFWLEWPDLPLGPSVSLYLIDSRTHVSGEGHGLLRRARMQDLAVSWATRRRVAR